MSRRHSILLFICVLSFLIFNFSFCIPSFAQDTASDEKTDQRNKLKLSELDESIVETALDLDGNDSYVEIFDSDILNTINQQVTVLAWIKATEFPNRYSPIIYKGDERTPDISNRSYVLFLRDDGAVQFASSPVRQAEEYIFSPSGAITLNRWHHVAGVVDTQRGVIKVFIDGNEVGSQNILAQEPFYESFLPLRIGGSHEEERDTHSSFVGQIDEISIWNVALTENHIRSYMKKPLKGNERGLVGYWNFDEENDGIISDVSPNQNDGRLIGNSKLIAYIRPFSGTTDPEQLARATLTYEKALTLEKNSYTIYRSLAEIYIKTDRYSDAEAIYLRALKADLTQSEHNDAIRALGQLFIRRGAEDELITHLEALRQKMEGSSILHKLLGDAYKNAGEEQKAELAYSQWLKIRKSEVDLKNQASEYYNLAVELLNKNIFPETALELAMKASERRSSSDYIVTLAQAFLVNEQYENAYQLISNIFDMMYLPFVERRLFLRVVKAGKNAKDKDGYVEMLNKLIESMPDNLRSHLNTTFALAQFYKENGMHDKAQELIHKTGFVAEDAWMVIGPFDNVRGIGYNTEYIPENLPQIDMTAKYDGKYRQVSWQKYTDEILNGYIGLGNDENWATGYAFATVNSPDEREVEFRFDSDDQGKVWLNGVEVFAHTKTFTAEIDNFIIPITLNAGKNSILVKVCEETGGWGFYLRITDKNGKPFDDLEIPTSTEK